MYFLPTGHLNAPLALRTLSEELFRREAGVVLNSAGYASGFYFTPRVADGSLVLVKVPKSAVQFYFSSIDGSCIAFCRNKSYWIGTGCFDVVVSAVSWWHGKRWLLLRNIVLQLNVR